MGCPSQGGKPSRHGEKLSPPSGPSPETLYEILELGIPIAWYEARIPVFPRKSIREGASSLFGPGPESPKVVSCSRATPRLHRCKSGLL